MSIYYVFNRVFDENPKRIPGVIGIVFGYGPFVVNAGVVVGRCFN